MTNVGEGEREARWLHFDATASVQNMQLHVGLLATLVIYVMIGKRDESRVADV